MLDKAVNFFLVHAAVLVPLLVLAALVLSSSARSGARTLARIVARLLLIAAAVAIAYDVTRTATGGAGLVMTSLLDHWSAISPATLEAARKSVSARLNPALWQFGVLPVLRQPAWLVAGVLAVLLTWLGRRRREIRIFAN